MFRRQPQLVAIVLTLSLVLAALPALAQGRPAAGAHGAQSALQATEWLRVTWGFLSGFWSGKPAGTRDLISIRGHEGASLDPDGKVRTPPTSIIVPPATGDEGASLDPHG
jgi:hypothetical protein